MIRTMTIALALTLPGCSAEPAKVADETATEAAPQIAFMNRIEGLCGKAFAGKLASSDAADTDMAGETLVMHVAQCGPDEIRIPFHVGDDRSRTWVLSRTKSGLRLKHDHRHEDGSADPVTMYGGDTIDAGSAGRQEFPADSESKAMFRREELDVSVDNVWAIEVDDDSFAYELRRPDSSDGRHFRAHFDLSEPVAPPPPAWGRK